jgi:ABC-2 type transport system ATP-binding protein
VFATHYLDEVEENADRVVMMKRGRIVADGTPAEIRAEAGGATVRFRMTGSATVTEQQLRRAFPGIGAVSVENGRVEVRTSDSDAVVRALARRGPGDGDSPPLPWRDLSVLPPSLDDSFLRLTGD